MTFHKLTFMKFSDFQFVFNLLFCEKLSVNYISRLFCIANLTEVDRILF